jgi:hypothetical protein
LYVAVALVWLFPDQRIERLVAAGEARKALDRPAH